MKRMGRMGRMLEHCNRNCILGVCRSESLVAQPLKQSVGSQAGTCIGAERSASRSLPFLVLLP